VTTLDLNPTAEVKAATGRLAAFEAIRNADTNALQEILQNFANIHCSDEATLRYAVELNDKDAVNILLTRGARPNEAILGRAVKAHNPAIVKMLSETDPALVHASDFRVLQLAFMAWYCDGDGSPAAECLEILFSGLQNNQQRNGGNALRKLNAIQTASWLTKWLQRRQSRQVGLTAAVAPVSPAGPQL
jgi:hypothetical protein